MRYLAALLILLYAAPVVPKQSDVQWWEVGVFGSCTRTDVIELGGCFKLEVSNKPKWN